MLKNKTARRVRRKLTRAWRGYLERHIGELMSLYPPYLGSGIRVDEADDDYRRVVVSMDLSFYNRNYVGTHFGGSLYSMCDPFYMLMLLKNLGPDYIVWDKAATIRFKKPGRGRVRAEFLLSKECIDEIREQADAELKVEPTFVVEVVDEEGDVVAQVDKVLYVRRKERD
jgi:acyl-coenzyme A thioesterase PaaI-like protein